VDTRSVASGDSIAYGAKQKSEQELLEAAEAALRWFDLFDQHAPSDMIFGGEARVRKGLRQAIRRARVEAETRDFADARDAAEAAALDEERARLGRRLGERERAAFLGGFRAARLEHTNGW
jgi:hypothetical protein